MKKVFVLGVFLMIAIICQSQGRAVHGYYAQVTIAANDSLCFPSMCVRGGNSGSRVFIAIDTIIELNAVKVGWDQTAGFKFNFTIYESYYGYGHFRQPIPYIFNSFVANNVDVFGGIDLETVLPAIIQSNLASAMAINQNRITVNCYYYNYPSY
jgi:hypothetical protein